MPKKYQFLENKLKKLPDGILIFDLYKVNVAPPRVYMNSKSVYYQYVRELGLPNISYLSVMKLLDPISNDIFLYFKIFIDYSSDILSYKSSIENESDNKNIADKEKDIINKSRIGQVKYRNKLLSECQFCPITLVNDERLLIASHIKPWKQSTDQEKVDPKNGFILTPTFDKLFDKGFITFNNDKKMIVSNWLSPMNQKRLGIYTGKIIKDLPMDKKREFYLQYHRKYIFKK